MMIEEMYCQKSFLAKHTVCHRENLKVRILPGLPFTRISNFYPAYV